MKTFNFGCAVKGFVVHVYPYHYHDCASMKTWQRWLLFWHPFPSCPASDVSLASPAIQTTWSGSTFSLVTVSYQWNEFMWIWKTCPNSIGADKVTAVVPVWRGIYKSNRDQQLTVASLAGACRGLWSNGCSRKGNASVQKTGTSPEIPSVKVQLHSTTCVSTF